MNGPGNGLPNGLLNRLVNEPLNPQPLNRGMNDAGSDYMNDPRNRLPHGGRRESIACPNSYVAHGISQSELIRVQRLFYGSFQMFTRSFHKSREPLNGLFNRSFTNL